MKLGLDEKELRRSRVESMAFAVDCFFTWLSAHSDAQDLYRGSHWHSTKQAYLEALGSLLDEMRDESYRKEGH